MFILEYNRIFLQHADSFLLPTLGLSWIANCIAYLPTLEKKRSINRPEPHDAVPGLEVPEPVAALVEKVPQTLQQLTCTRLQCIIKS